MGKESQNKNYTFQADCEKGAFERHCQNKMKAQKPLNKWCIIHSRSTKQDANVFRQEIKNCLDHT